MIQVFVSRITATEGVGGLAETERGGGLITGVVNGSQRIRFWNLQVGTKGRGQIECRLSGISERFSGDFVKGLPM